MAFEAGRAANVEFGGVTTRENAAQAVGTMLDDLSANPDAWENPTLPRFLEALSAVIDSIPNAYTNQGKPEPVLDWRHMVEMLVVATGYE